MKKRSRSVKRSPLLSGHALLSGQLSKFPYYCNFDLNKAVGPHELGVIVLLVPYYVLFFSNHVIVAITLNPVSEF